MIDPYLDFFDTTHIHFKYAFKKIYTPIFISGTDLKKYIYLIKKEVAQYIKNSPRIIFNSQLYIWIPRFFMWRASILLNDSP